MNKEAASALYGNLRKRIPNFTMDEGDFYAALEDENKRKALHKNMQERIGGFTMDYPAFSQQLGFTTPTEQQQQSFAQATGGGNAFMPLAGIANRESERQIADKEAQMQREEQAQMPISDHDRQLQEQIRQKEIEGKWGKPNGTTFGVDKQTGMPTINQTEGDGTHLYAGEQLANQDEIDALKGQLPSYLTREVKTPQDLLVNTAEAWSSNTEMGRDFKDMLEAGTITPEDYKQAMIEANQDYINQQTRILGQKATNATIADISKTINPIIEQMQAERQKAIERAAGQGQMRGGAYGAIGAQMSANMAYDSKKDAVLSEYLQAQQYLVDAIKISEAAQKGQGFWKGLGNSLGDVDTWDMGISQLVRSANLKKIVEKYEKKPDSLTDSEKALMDAAVAYMSACAYNSDKLSRLYKAGQTTGESLPFMLQFAVMPVGAVKDKVAKGILGYGIEQFGGKALQTAGKYSFGRAAAETGVSLLGNIAAAGVQTGAFGGAKIAEGTISRMTGDIKPEFDENGRIVYGGRENQQGLGEALWNAGVDTYVENLSEMILTSGDPIKAFVRGTDLFKNLTKNEAIQVLTRMSEKWGESTMGKMAGRMQFRNYPEEVAEEYVGNLLRWGASTDVNSAAEAGLDADSQIDLWMGLAPTSIAFAGLGLGEYSVRGGIDRFQSSQAARKLRKIMLEGEERKYLENLLKSRDSDEFKFAAHDVVKTILRNDKLSPQEKRSYLDNLYVTYQSQLALEAEDAKIADEVKTEVQGITNKNNGYVYPVSLAGDPNTQGHIVAGYIEVDVTDPSKPHIGNDEIVTVKLNDGRVVQLSTKELDLTGTPQMAQEVFNTRAEERINAQRIMDKSKSAFHEGEEGTVQVPNPQTGELDEFPSKILSVTDEGVQVEIADLVGQSTTALISHDEALRSLRVVKPQEVQQEQPQAQETPAEQPVVQQPEGVVEFTNGQQILLAKDNGDGTYVVLDEQGNPQSEPMPLQDYIDSGYRPKEQAQPVQPEPAQPVAPQEPAQPIVQQPAQPVQPAQPAEPIQPEPQAPDVNSNVTPEEFAAQMTEYMGSPRIARGFLLAEQKKIEAQLKKIEEDGVKDYTDAADYRTKAQQLEQTKQALQTQLDKINSSIAVIEQQEQAAEQSAQAQAEAEAAAKAEAERLAAEQQAEQERLAAEETARLAAEQKAAEEQRLAAEQQKEQPEAQVEQTQTEKPETIETPKEETPTIGILAGKDELKKLLTFKSPEEERFYDNICQSLKDDRKYPIAAPLEALATVRLYAERGEVEAEDANAAVQEIDQTIEEVKDMLGHNKIPADNYTKAWEKAMSILEKYPARKEPKEVQAKQENEDVFTNFRDLVAKENPEQDPQEYLHTLSDEEMNALEDTLNMMRDDEQQDQDLVKQMYDRVASEQGRRYDMKFLEQEIAARPEAKNEDLKRLYELDDAARRAAMSRSGEYAEKLHAVNEYINTLSFEQIEAMFAEAVRNEGLYGMPTVLRETYDTLFKQLNNAEVFDALSKKQGTITGKANKPKINVKDWLAGKDDPRAVLTGVHNDPSGVGVATNAHILIATPQLYDKAQDGKTVTPDGTVIENAKFPYWQGVMDQARRSCTATATVDWTDVRNFIQGCKDKMKAEGNPLNKKNLARIVFRMPDGKVFGFRMNMFIPFAEAAATFDASELRYSPNQGQFFVEKDGNMALVMPLSGLGEERADELDTFFYDMQAEQAPAETPAEAPKQADKAPAAKKAAPSAEVVEQPKAKIGDVGEKIGGARKDIVQTTVDRINVNGETFSKIFPKFDYHKLIESGLEPCLAAGLKYVCEHAKKTYKMRKKRYGENNALEATRFLANYAKGYLLGDTSLDFTSNGWVFTDYGKRKYEFAISLWEELQRRMGDSMFDVDLTDYDGDIIPTEEERKAQAAEKGHKYTPSTNVYFRNVNGESTEFTPRYEIYTPHGTKLFTEEEREDAIKYFADNITQSVSYKAANPFQLAVFRKQGTNDECIHAKIGGKWVEITPWGKEYGLQYRDDHRAELQALAQRKAEELKEQRKNEKPVAKVELRLMKNPETGEYGNRFVIKLDKEYVPVIDEYFKVADSYNYQKAHRDEIQAKAQEILDKYLEEKEANKGWKPELNIGGLRSRVGEDWRGGKDVTAEQFRDTFGFRGVEFGNYVTQKERQRLLNECYDALRDMAQLLGVSPKALSLDGQLGFAIGARGGAGAKAHYEPEKNVINLTKKNGWGAVAHEWWHALDYYFGQREKGNPALASRFRPDIRAAVETKFKELMATIQDTDYLKRSMALDRKTGKTYYATATEMGARAFEDYITRQLIQQGRTNDFLSHHTSPEDWNGDMANYPYPIEGDAEQISNAIQSLFDTMDEKTSEATGNQVLYSYLSRKEQQMSIINGTNPMLDDVHTGIRSVDDIHTLEETLNDSKLLVTEPDWEEDDIKRAVESGEVTIYSSYPIENGVFVTPSRMVAEDYAGEGEVYSKTVPVDKVAWIASDEGQYADVDELSNIGTRLTEPEQLATDALLEVLQDNPSVNLHIATDEEARKFMEEEAQKKSLNETATWRELMLHTNYAADISSNDGAKVLKNIETTKQKLEKSSNLTIKDPISVLSHAIGLQKTGLSYYGTFKTGAGNVVTLRISNHNATVSNFDNMGETEGISIVITPQRLPGITNDGAAHIIEYYYRKNDFAKYYGKPLAEILGSIKGLLEKGEYVDTTGLAQVEEVNIPDQRTAQLSFSNASEEIFYSNAERAVEGIKQEKATPEQWRAMIEKAGGLKAGEDKWIGLSDWLAQQRPTVTPQEGETRSQFLVRLGEESKRFTISKQDILDYIREHKIQIEEQEYGEYEEDALFLERKDEFKRYYDEAVEAGEEDPNEVAWDRMIEEYGDDFSLGYYAVGDELMRDNDSDYAQWEADSEGRPRNINETRLQYTTDGLQNKREIALVVPTIESWNQGDEIHFGDAGEGRAIAWVRFGDTHKIKEDWTDGEGNLHKGAEALEDVLVIDEIQSKRHQDGREHGYIEKSADKAMTDYTNMLYRKYGAQFNVKMSDEERMEYRRLQREREFERQDNLSRPTAAPFEKNWHELAMKRILRFAAENGYDKVAWTTGDQQAARYDIGAKVEKVTVEPYGNGRKEVKVYKPDGYADVIDFDENGVCHDDHYNGAIKNKSIQEIFGKDLGKKIAEATDKSTFEGEDLRIGGEGMRGFYDDILPRFMQKYGKKWGVQVGEVTMPQLEDGYQTMHAIDINDAMRESVMEGQPMFMRTPKGVLYGWAVGNNVYLTKDGLNPRSPIHEYSHLWVESVKQHNSELYDNLKDLFSRENLPGMWKQLDKEEQYSDLSEDGKLSEIISRFSERGGKRMEEEAKRMMDDAKKKGKNAVANTATLIQRMKNVLKRLWDWVGEHLFNIKNFGSREEAADRILYDMINKTDLQLDENPNRGAEFQIIGSKGATNLDRAEEATIRMDNLEVARLMEHQQKTPKEIRMATGWERGADGAWRYEIPDIKIKENVTINKDFDKTFRLPELVDAPELFAAYPEMKDYRVTYSHNIPIGIGGKFSKRNRLIYMNALTNIKERLAHQHKEELEEIRKQLPAIDDLVEANRVLWNTDPNDKEAMDAALEQCKQVSDRLKDNPLWERYRKLDMDGMITEYAPSGDDVLSHEIQHAIQAIEGFSRGSNLEDMEMQSEYRRQSIANLQEHIKELEAKLPKPTEQWTEEHDAISKEIEDTERKILNLRNMNVQREAYNNAGGEVESRNVQNRMKLTPEERRERLLAETEDVAREDQVFLFHDSLLDADDATYSFNEEKQKIMADWHEQNPHPQYEEGEDLEHYRERLEAWKKAYDEMRGQTNGMPEEPKVEQPTSAETTAEPIQPEFLGPRELIRKFEAMNSVRMSPESVQARNRMIGNMRALRDQLHRLREAEASEVGAITGEIEQGVRDRQLALRAEYEKSAQMITDLAKDLFRGKVFLGMTDQDFSKMLTNIREASTKYDLQKNIEIMEDIVQRVQGRYLKASQNALNDAATIMTQRRNRVGVDIGRWVDPIHHVMISSFDKLRNTSVKHIDNVLADLNAQLNAETSETELDLLASKIAGAERARAYREQLDQLESDLTNLDLDIHQLDRYVERNNLRGNKRKEFMEQRRALMRERMDKMDELILLNDRTVDELSGITKDGRSNFIERIKKKQEHKIEVLRFASRDLAGIRDDKSADDKDKGGLKDMYLSPLRTFTHELRKFGTHSAGGEGYLYSYFAPLAHDARSNYLLHIRERMDILDAKAKELFGEKATWDSVMKNVSNKLTEVEATWEPYNENERTVNSAGVQKTEKKKPIYLTNGQMMYIYMVNKMTDGKAKLGQMGITEDVVAELKAQLPKELVKLADWLQEEYFPMTRKRYNATNIFLYDTPMAEIPNYVPLKISGDAIEPQTDIQQGKVKLLPSNVVGSAISRTYNRKPIDIRNTDAMDLVVQNMMEMEHWSAYAELITDLNTLLNNLSFKNRIEQMNPNNYDNFYKTCQLVVEQYRPDVGPADALVAGLTRFIATSKISLRWWTAIKQRLSSISPLSEADPEFHKQYAKAYFHCKDNFQWAMENLPIFRERWESKQGGNEKLNIAEINSKSQKIQDMLEWAQENLVKYGISANAFVDAITCANMAKAQYETKKKYYTERGYSPEAVESLAKWKADEIYNETQQSSEGAYISAMQRDRTFVSSAISLFNNSSMAYTRKNAEALREIYKIAVGDKQAFIDFRKEQLMKDGMAEDQAAKFAETDYKRARTHAIADAAINGYIIQFVWNYGGKAFKTLLAVLPFLLFGDDDEKKKAKEELLKDLKKDAVVSTIQPVRGLPFGGTFDTSLGVVYDIATGQTERRYMSKTEVAGKIASNMHPSIDDISKLLSSLTRKEIDEMEFASYLVNIATASGTSIDAQTLANILWGLEDLTENTFKGKLTWADVRNDLAVILNAPPSQIEYMILQPHKGESRTQFVERYTKYIKLKKYGILTPFAEDPELSTYREKKADAAYDKE